MCQFLSHEHVVLLDLNIHALRRHRSVARDGKGGTGPGGKYHLFFVLVMLFVWLCFFVGYVFCLVILFVGYVFCLVIAFCLVISLSPLGALTS